MNTLINIGLTLWEDKEGADVKESDVKSQHRCTRCHCKGGKQNTNRSVLKGCRLHI